METRYRLLLIALTVALLVAGCSLASAQPERDAQRVKGPPGSLRIGFSTAADMGDIPSLMALELLAERGYKTEPIFFSGAELSVAALSKGDVHFGNGSTRTSWAAIAKGADIVTVMEQAANAWSIVSTTDITSCAGLQGKRIAITSTGSLNAALLSAYLQMNCPSIEPRIILIANSENRAAALMAGKIDAAPLETSDFLRVKRMAPGRFHALVDFAASLPRLKTTGIYVNRALARRYPEVVQDYLEAVLTVHRRIQSEPALIEAAIVKHLGIDKAEAAELARFYLAKVLWDVNGGMDLESIAYSIDFFTKSGSLPPGLRDTEVADLTYLDQVLAKIGRQ